MFEGGSFVNIQNKKALDVKDSKDDEGQNVDVRNRSGKTNQLWTVEYLDKKAPVVTKGLNAEFNLHCNRPFYLVSRLPMKRVAESIGANNITLKRWRKNVKAQ
jgi:hypothetical protein